MNTTDPEPLTDDVSATETLTDDDLTGIDEGLHQTARYVDFATGSKEFAITLCKKLQDKRKGAVGCAWGFEAIMRSALDHGIDRGQMITQTENLLDVLSKFFTDSDRIRDMDAEWNRIEKERAEEARKAELLRAIAAESDDEDFAPFFAGRLHWFANKDDPSLLGKVTEFLEGADNECFDLTDVTNALKRHAGIPESTVDAACDEFANKQRQEQRREVLRRIRSHYDSDEPYRGLGASVISMSWAAMGNTSAPPAIWGDGMEVLWAGGESLIIEASYGVGKTTLAGLLVRGKIYGQAVLGYPVRKLPDGQRILYLALDRPDQIVRSMLRQFTHEQLDELGKRLSIWRGPLPGDAGENDHLLTDIADMHEADVLFVDSVKDAALGLSEDRAAAIYQRGRQRLLQSGRQLVELHHLTKGGDAYGSIWLNAGVGSVVRLKGSAGGPTATLTHIKSPARRLDPIAIVHDRPKGEMTAASPVSDESAEPAPAATEETAARSLTDWVAEHGEGGVTAKQLVEHQGGDVNAEAALVKAKRTLNVLVGDDGLLRRIDGNGRGNPTRWAVAR